MTEETKVEVALHDEEINDIVEETLEETTEVVEGTEGEDESIASVKKSS